MSVRHYLNKDDQELIRSLVARNGLRPVVDAVGAAAMYLMEHDQPVMDAEGDPMDAEDIETAAANLADDLY